MDAAFSTEQFSAMLGYFLTTVALASGLILVSWLVGGRHRSKERDEPFESGVAPCGDARIRLSAKFYLYAMFFVIFDLEAVYLFAWAIALEQSGWTGFAEAAIFILVLLAALLYLWRLGGLEGEPEGYPPVVRSTNLSASEE